MNTENATAPMTYPELIEDIYPLSPIQQGMLFHALHSPESSLYLLQGTCEIKGRLDLNAFEAAWQKVMDRHPSMRTSFVWEELEQPVQVIHKDIECVVDNYDWRYLSGAAQQKEFESYLKQDRKHGFELSEAPLMRLALMRLAENEYRFVWSYYHGLLDGWSGTMLLQEVATYYAAAIVGQDLELAKPRPYKNYIGWLQRQDIQAAKSFWQTALAGFTSPTELPGSDGKLAASDHSRVLDQTFALDARTTAALQRIARQYQVTLNTVVRGAWALLLSRYTGQADVVFGATVAGRPVSLHDVDTMIGLFINTLPVRVRMNSAQPLGDWFRTLQQEQADAQQYEYMPLVDIQNLCEIERGAALFETLLVFENYATDGSASAADNPDGLKILNAQTLDSHNYPLAVVVVTGEQLTFRIAWDEARFSTGMVDRLACHFQNLLESIA